MVRQEGVRQGHRRFHEAIRLDPNDALAYNNRGYAWSNKKDYDKAIADYDEAIRLDPDDATAYCDRGNAWQDKKDVRQGHRRLQRGHPARSEQRDRLPQPRLHVACQEGVRQGHRRLRRGNPARPERHGLQQPRQRVETTRRSTTRPSPTTTRPSGSIRTTRPLTTTAAIAWHNKKDYDKAIADYNEAIRLDPKTRDRLSTTAATRGTTRRTTTRPSPTTARPFASIRSSRWRTTTAAARGIARRSTTRPSPTTMRPFDLIQVRPGVRRACEIVRRKTGIRESDGGF